MAKYLLSSKNHEYQQWAESTVEDLWSWPGYVIAQPDDGPPLKPGQTRPNLPGPEFAPGVKVYHSRDAHHLGAANLVDGPITHPWDAFEKAPPQGPPHL